MIIGIIGALEEEVSSLKSKMKIDAEETVSGIKFCIGSLGDAKIVVAKCGIGKVFAALCAQTMILKYNVTHIINTGIGGALAPDLKLLDLVISDKLVQHDMDTSAIGDPKGLVSGINKVFFDASPSLINAAKQAAESLGISHRIGSVASGDKFVASHEEKERIVSDFGADVCEMEGAAIAHVCYINNVEFLVIRAISDGADENSSMDYPQLVTKASAISSKLVENTLLSLQRK